MFFHSIYNNTKKLLIDNTQDILTSTSKWSNLKTLVGGVSSAMKRNISKFPLYHFTAHTLSLKLKILMDRTADTLKNVENKNHTFSYPYPSYNWMMLYLLWGQYWAHWHADYSGNLDLKIWWWLKILHFHILFVQILKGNILQNWGSLQWINLLSNSVDN